MEIYDCIIIGGGPAGLNAAVVLGRCRRKVLVFDTYEQRNRKSHGMHNYLTRDDILPPEFIRLSEKELEKYSVQKLQKRIVSATRNDDGLFEVKDEKKQKYFSKKLLVATGLADKVPEIEGFQEFYGQSVFHCPYCDGWEVRDKKIGVYARDKDGWELALALKGWTSEVVLYTDGKKRVKPNQKEQLDACGVQLVTLPIHKLEGTQGKLKKIIFTNGESADCDAMFFVNGYDQQCNMEFDPQRMKRPAMQPRRSFWM